jgi:metal-responsive CopG/Arc/MetJ family transcriptional regulator
MRKTIVKQKKKLGRPSMGQSAFVALRLSPQLVARIDRWGEKNGIAGRSEAIRALLERSTSEPK